MKKITDQFSRESANTGIVVIDVLNLMGNCTSDQKLARFVRFLKIINTFVQNKICILL